MWATHRSTPSPVWTPTCSQRALPSRQPSRRASPRRLPSRLMADAERLDCACVVTPGSAPRTRNSTWSRTLHIPAYGELRIGGSTSRPSRDAQTDGLETRRETGTRYARYETRAGPPGYVSNDA